MAAPLAVDNPNTGSLAHLEAPRTLPTAHSLTPPLYLERFASRPSTFPTTSPLYWRLRLRSDLRLLPILEDNKCKFKLDTSSIGNLASPVHLGTLTFLPPVLQMQGVLVDKLLELWAANPQALLNAALDVLYPESNLSTSESPPTQSQPLQGVTFTRAPGLDIYLDSKKLDDTTFQEKYDGCDRDEWSQFWEKQRKLEKEAEKAAKKEAEKAAKKEAEKEAARSRFNDNLGESIVHVKEPSGKIR
ncbi:hypothetical protein EV360DRAFT_86602 [Lentinula raphanica]|nr:hypothetical protein EV360DRAFT_86602 [Lentinula raphanica]